MEDGSENVSPHWTFGGALLYSLTLLTTVGYGRLSPRTALGKVAAVIYAIIGVPLMLVLLSTLGAMLASAIRKLYSKFCCQKNSTTRSPAVGYHKAPSSPSVKYCKNLDDTASIQLSSSHNTPNHICKMNHHGDHQMEVPKKALLATVRSTHVRGRCRQTQVRQMLADTQICPTHSHGTPSKTSMSAFSDIEDADEADESEHGPCQHDTPSRIPLIWHPPEMSRRSPSPITLSSPLPPSSPSSSSPSTPSVPAIVVVLLFFSYICIGAAIFVTTNNWSVLDGIYFCFIALSTIGIGDKLPQNGDYQTQLQILACCLYLFIGLVIVAMCFSLVHEEIATKCKHIAHNMGLVRH